MRVRRSTLAAVLALAAISLLPPSARATGPLCDGQEATIVGTDSLDYPDHLIGTEGVDVVVLGAGDDTFAGKGGDDVICGDSGGDRIYAGAGNDTVLGGSGNDRIFEGSGDDSLDGGIGRDRLLYTSSGADGVRIDAVAGTATSSGGSDAFTSFEGFVGTTGRDTLLGTDAGEYFDGWGGQYDEIRARGGADQIVTGRHGTFLHVSAGDGDDLVDSSGGESSVDLGPGNDKIRYAGYSGGSTWRGGLGTDAVSVNPGLHGVTINLKEHYVLVTEMGQGGDLWTAGSFENAVGSSGPDRIVGTSGPNWLYGGNGRDVLIGLGGEDRLIGGYDVDTCIDERTTAC